MGTSGDGDTECASDNIADIAQEDNVTAIIDTRDGFFSKATVDQ